MNLTGMKRWVQSTGQLFTGLAVMAILLAGSGCTGSQNVRKARPMAIETPDTVEIVASEASEASEADVEVAAASAENPSSAQEEAASPEAELLAAVTKGENGVAEALQQTRGAVFASLTTPTGAGPPASAVKTSDVAPSEEGFQDSSTQLSGNVEGGVESGAVATNEDPPQEEAGATSENEIIQEEAESSIAESSPAPEPVVPVEEAESPAVEATRLAQPPEPEPVPVSEELSREGLTTHDPAGAEGTSRSNTASVLFLILGGVGAALILLRKRIAA